MSVKETLNRATERDYMRSQNHMLSAHLGEMGRKKAEAFNLGWASGDDFIHSKTDKGRLFTQRTGQGKYKHEWSG